MIKYNITPTHPGALPYEHLLRRGTVGDVPAALSTNGWDYLSPLTIGSQTFLLEFDTGSPDLWVYSVFEDSTPSGKHTIYNPTNSKTAVKVDKEWGISYQDGSRASGIVFEDTVKLGGITIKNQAIEAAVDVSGLFLQVQPDGILGLSLAPNTIRPGNTPTTLQNLAGNSQLTEPLFTCVLTRANEGPGYYTFGYLPPELQGNNSPQYLPVDNSNGFWQLPSEYAIINGQRVDRTGNTAVADTGTTIIHVSDDLLPIIYKPLGGYFDKTQQGWVFPANVTLAQVPSIVLPIGGYDIQLAPEDIAFAADGDIIFGAIQSRGNLDWDVFGDYWLRNIYAVWRFVGEGEGPLFGFAPRPSS